MDDTAYIRHGDGWRDGDGLLGMYAHSLWRARDAAKEDDLGDDGADVAAGSDDTRHDAVGAAGDKRHDAKVCAAGLRR